MKKWRNPLSLGFYDRHPFIVFGGLFVVGVMLMTILIHAAMNSGISWTIDGKRHTFSLGESK